MSNIVIIYHSPCNDGLTGAWLLNKVYPGATLYGAQHKTEPPLKLIEGKHVIMVDFCYPLEHMQKLVEIASFVEVYDHHKGVESILKFVSQYGNAHVVYDVEHSGAGIVFREFFERLPTNIILNGWNRIVQHVQAIDLWRFESGDDHDAFIAYLRSYDMNFDVLDIIINMSPNEYELCLVEGRIILRARASIVKEFLSMLQYVKMEIDGIIYERVPVVNAPYMYASELGHLILKTTQSKFAVTYYTNEEGTYKLSIRSQPDYSCIPLAQALGGNGHPQAAGATVKQLPWHSLDYSAGYHQGYHDAQINHTNE